MFNSRLIITCEEADPSFVVGKWPFICAFSYCNNYETNCDKNQNLNSSSGIVIRPPPCVEFIGSWSSPHMMDSVHYTTVLKAFIFSSASYTSSSKMSQFHEWFCVAMLTEQALASKKMIFLKKYLMKYAKNKFLDLLNFHNFQWVTHHIPLSARSHIAKIKWN